MSTYDVEHKLCAELNRKILLNGLSKLAWGNASLMHANHKTISIKASGVMLEDVSSDDIVDVDIKTGKALPDVLSKRPSVDTPTHLKLYKLPNVNAVVHMHSLYATSFAQAGLSIPCVGTTHADAFPCDIPIVHNEVPDKHDAYERIIGDKLYECLKQYHGLKAVLLESHGVFVIGSSVAEVIENAVTLEYCAQLAYNSFVLRGLFIEAKSRAMLLSDLQQFHYERKHGKNKRYGQ